MKPVAPPPIAPAPKPAPVPIPVFDRDRPLPKPSAPAAPAFNWEQFMGVKLIAWVSGLALFLGIAFFVKYSFDNNLVPPELRVAVGFLAGLGLMVGGVLMSRRQPGALAQTLCATGVLVLYATTFACRSIYKFEFFSPVVAFAFMTLITTTAFLLAVRLNAMVVAILGMLGGFMTPVLLSTGKDNPLGLFGYLAILDAGLLLVALHRRWLFLNALAAAGTLFMQVGWAGKFFTPERYFDGNKILIALAVLLGFDLLYLAGDLWSRRRQQANLWLSGSVLGLSVAALAFAGWFLTFPTLAQRPGLLFSFVMAIDLVVCVVAGAETALAAVQPVFGLGVFGLLALWTKGSLQPETLNTALAFYFLFAALHAAFLVYLQRRRKIAAPLWASDVFPPLALLLVLLPILNLTEVSFLVWPFVLLVDLLAIGLAVLSASLLSVLAVLGLTLAATGALIYRVPTELTGMPVSFSLLAVFTVFFVGVGVWLSRRFKPAMSGAQRSFNEDVAAKLPALSASLPFLLLIMAVLRLPLANPSPVFGLALLLTVLLLGVARLFASHALPALALGGVAALEYAWHFHRFDPAAPVIPLQWYLLFYAIFTLYPFLFLKRFAGATLPWSASALAGLPQFLLIHRLVAAAYPNSMMGLLAAAFAVPPLLSLVAVLKRVPAESQARLTQLALYGGVALFFITLIFPLQFDRQWLTIGWGLEGAALLWLYHRVPHRGLQTAGAALLVAAFARLALNPAVFEYHARADAPILNWYLYAYGIVTATLFAAGKLSASPRDRLYSLRLPPLFISLGTVLAFLLLNIEIADYFSQPGAHLTFDFTGNFARDMSYSIAWAIFALLLLVIGIARRLPASRYAALALLGVTLLKLFIHDLASLGQLYRIGAFIGVAIIAMLASLAYQRFFNALNRQKDPDHAQEPPSP
jgi:uncharacterized membrane protein